MSNGLIAFVSLIYLGVTASELHDRNYGMALMFFSYALANVGVIIARGH